MLHKPVEELCAHACACYLIKLDIYLAGKVGGSGGGATMQMHVWSRWVGLNNECSAIGGCCARSAAELCR